MHFYYCCFYTVAAAAVGEKENNFTKNGSLAPFLWVGLRRCCVWNLNYARSARAGGATIIPHSAVVLLSVCVLCVCRLYVCAHYSSARVATAALQLNRRLHSDHLLLVLASPATPHKPTLHRNIDDLYLLIPKYGRERRQLPPVACPALDPINHRLIIAFHRRKGKFVPDFCLFKLLSDICLEWTYFKVIRVCVL